MKELKASMIEEDVRGVFRALGNTSEGVFVWKELTTFNNELISQNRLTVDAGDGPNYASGWQPFFFL